MSAVPRQMTALRALQESARRSVSVDLLAGQRSRTQAANLEYASVRLVGQPGEPAFQGTWSNSTAEIDGVAGGRPVGYFRDREGFVHLQGRAASSSAPTTPIFTLPAALVPAATERWTVPFAVSGGGVSGTWLRVETDGDVWVDGSNVTGAVAWMSLDGWSYRAANAGSY